ncbi:hypothetical protein BD414DRAFT_289948 [Trametes punicea]|nr:hypothetical protein BD414DRAFT_289948 [Trametes punicea]
MASYFRYVFGCCIRSHSRSPNPEPDENTPFIPPSDDAPPPRMYTVDHERMKERLGTIVRSKEGKMVNVNQPLPFNLHGYGRGPHIHRTGSSSTNTTPPRASSSAAQALGTDESSIAAGQAHNPRLPSYSPSREPSPSIQTSRSTSSLHPGDASYLPPEVDPEGGNRRPILNVRLVRANGRRSSGGRIYQLPTTERGRQGRPGGPRGQDVAAANPEDPTGQSQASAKDNSKGKARENSADKALDATSSTIGGACDAAGDSGIVSYNADDMDTQGGSNAQASAPPNGTSDSDFKVDDIGKIAESWGD